MSEPTNTTVKRSATSSKALTSKVQLPKDAYVLRVIDESFAPSKSSGKDMITLEVEIVHPQVVKDSKGNEIECGGYKFKTYFPLHNDDAKIQERMRNNLFDLWEKIGKPVEDFDVKNPPLFFKEAIENEKPLELDVILYGKKNSPMGPDGKPILMGGKPVEEYQVQIDSWHGISTTDTSAVAF